MKNNKIFKSLSITISVLLILIILGIIFQVVFINISKPTNYGIATYSDNVETILAENDNKLMNSENLSDSESNYNAQDILEKRKESILATVSSRSEVNRYLSDTMYISTQEQNIQDDYEELKTYINLEDVQISFNMDVSKPTGLSKEDFVSLVQNMKKDKTGILENNAEWIWECCQKYNVNEIFVLGVCGIESAWCSASQHQATHNYSSLMKGGKLIAYSSDREGFEAMIKLLGQKYLTPGASLYHGSTITGVGTAYCNTTTWPKKVYTCMQQVFI